jgi:hypothetical protein
MMRSPISARNRDGTIDAFVLLDQEKIMNLPLAMSVLVTSVGLNTVALAEPTFDTSIALSRSELVHIEHMPGSSETVPQYPEKIARSQEDSYIDSKVAVLDAFECMTVTNMAQFIDADMRRGQKLDDVISEIQSQQDEDTKSTAISALTTLANTIYRDRSKPAEFHALTFLKNCTEQANEKSTWSSLPLTERNQ